MRVDSTRNPSSVSRTKAALVCLRQVLAYLMALASVKAASDSCKGDYKYR